MKLNLKKNKKWLFLCSILSFCLVGGIYSYLFTLSSKESTIYFGDIKIDLIEERWNQYLENNDGKIVIGPKAKITKDPKIKNIKNEAYVFLEVELPYIELEEINDEGTVETKNYDSVFDYNLNANWKEISSVSSAENKTLTKIYAYVNDVNATQLEAKKVGASESTNTLFDEIIVKNVKEADYLNGVYSINLKAYGIQTVLVDNKNEPNEIWQIIQNQNTSKFNF